MTTIHCARCGQDRDRQAFKPFGTELGQRVYDSICKVCWGDWLKTQQQLINHYGLIPYQPTAKEFLLRNMEQFFFAQGAPDSIA